MMLHRVDADTSIYYEVSGSGSPVLLVAGTGCDDSWWALQVAEFARRHTVITCHTRGAGRSTIHSDPARYSTEVMADDLASLLVALDQGPAHVIGHSLGSCIAQQLAIRHPGVVRTAQFHATWAAADEWLRRGFIGTTSYAVRQRDPQFTWKTVSMWVFSPTYLEWRTPQRVKDAVTRAFIDNPHLDNDRGLLGHLHADAQHDTRKLLPEVDRPVLVTAGEHDASFPPRYGQWVYEQMPRARWHLFRGERAAHAFNLEMAEEFNHVALGFMADHD